MARHGIEWPSGSLPGKHYEGEFVPSDGKPFRPPLARWHTHASEVLGMAIDEATFPEV